MKREIKKLKKKYDLEEATPGLFYIGEETLFKIFEDVKNEIPKDSVKIIQYSNYLEFTTKDEGIVKTFNDCWDRGHLHFCVKNIGCKEGIHYMVLAPSVVDWERKKK